MNPSRSIRREILCVLCILGTFFVAGCWPAATSYHSSRMLGLAHSAELSADEIKKTNAELRATNERLEEEIDALRSVVAQAEHGSSTARTRVATPQTAPKKSSKAKGSYTKIRSAPKDTLPVEGAASGS